MKNPDAILQSKMECQPDWYKIDLLKCYLYIPNIMIFLKIYIVILLWHKWQSSLVHWNIICITLIIIHIINYYRHDNILIIQGKCVYLSFRTEQFNFFDIGLINMTVLQKEICSEFLHPHILRGGSRWCPGTISLLFCCVVQWTFGICSPCLAFEGSHWGWAQNSFPAGSSCTKLPPHLHTQDSCSSVYIPLVHLLPVQLTWVSPVGQQALAMSRPHPPPHGLSSLPASWTPQGEQV